MGNVQVISKRVGVRANPQADIVFKESPEVEAHEGIEPAEVVVQMRLDKYVKLASVRFVWHADDTVFMPVNHMLLESRAAVAMEILTASCHMKVPWPIGRYRVDCFVGDAEQPSETCSFVVRNSRNDAAKCTMHFQVSPESPKVAFNGIIAPSAGELTAHFETIIPCDVRQESYIKWHIVDAPEVARDAELLSLNLPQGMNNLFHSTCSLARPWPVGTYSVSLVVNGYVLNTTKFDCVSPTVDLDCEVTQGQPVDKKLSPDGGPLACRFFGNGLVNVLHGARVVWVAVLVDEAPPNTVVASVDLPAGKHDTFKSTCTLQRSWPRGKYRVQLFVDDALIKAHDFDIQ